MGVIRNIFIIVVIQLAIFSTSWSQETPQVHKINGSKYYLHVVEPGNTLYGISRLYNLAIDEVLKANPVVESEGLKVNQTLLIPVTGDNKKSLGGLVEETDEFMIHEVQPKETLYAISKKYDITLNVLLNANPEIREDGLKAGGKVKIPVEKVQTEEKAFIESAEPDSLKAHIVEKGQTLYAISKQYSVSVEALMKSNVGLNSEIKEGMAIRIPGTKITVRQAPKDTTVAEKDSVVRFVPDTNSSFVRVALLLPIQPVFPDSSTKHDFKIDEVQRLAISFYRGFVHAIDSLAAKNKVRFEVELLQSGVDTAHCSSLLRSGKLDSFDVVVGPFYTDQFMMVADYLRPKGTPTICPVPKPSKILFGRPNAMKTTPSESMQWDAIAEFLALNAKDSNVVVVNSNKITDADRVEFFKSRYTVAKDLPDTFINDAIREVKLWDINRETLTMRFPDSGSYVVVVPSDNKVFVTKLLADLYNMQYEIKDKYRFRLIGPEEWRKYAADLDIEQLHALNVTIPVTEYMDFDDYRINMFFKHYRNTHGYEPDRFTLTGFDLGNYLINQMAFNRLDWYVTPEKFQFQGLLMNFHFHRVIDQSGVENQSVDLYEYDSFKLKPYISWPIQEK